MYTIYNTAAEAITANATKAEAEGCNMVSTAEWWPRVKHPVDGRWALKDGSGPMSHADMITDGWFPDEEEA